MYKNIREIDIQGEAPVNVTTDQTDLSAMVEHTSRFIPTHITGQVHDTENGSSPLQLAVAKVTERERLPLNHGAMMKSVFVSFWPGKNQETKEVICNFPFPDSYGPMLTGIVNGPALTQSYIGSACPAGLLKTDHLRN